ncbi:MAG: hypothetical protein CVV05_00555 [Gammaproteobacteria bacterium HGW-Gammaproteobacteria-1]|jgi:hypothetical protein|nr:MAG: hypothetical protein CVV05_00555 [Gammaproteobacteria bacterium HGW-Gammaproteobacteria-1]
MNAKPLPQGYKATHLGLAVEPLRERPVSKEGFLEYTAAAAASECQQLMVEGQKTIKHGTHNKPTHTDASAAILGGHSRGGPVHVVEPPAHLKNPDGSFNLNLAGISLALEEMDTQVPLTTVMNLKPSVPHTPGTEYEYKNPEDAGRERPRANFTKGMD